MNSGNTTIKTKDTKYYDYLKNNGLILFESIVGSTAHGTKTVTSDTDKRFIYIEPLDKILNDTVISQLNVMGDDFVGYEVGRFIELLHVGNPNMLELLNSPDDCITYLSGIFREHFLDNRDQFNSKKAAVAFGLYASTQIEKARGENKKIVKPMGDVRKGLLDFCWVTEKHGSRSLVPFLKNNNIEIEACGVSAIDHMKNCYNLFADREYNAYLNILKQNKNAVEAVFYKPKSSTSYKGIVDKKNEQIVLSSIEKGKGPIVMFYCNIEGFTKYCTEFADYQKWIKNRNEERFKKNMELGAQYDTKNMMHCHRLLDVSIEMLRDGKLNVRRSNVEELLSIKNGLVSYDKLIEASDTKTAMINELKKTTPLPDNIQHIFFEKLLLEVRKKFYGIK